MIKRGKGSIVLSLVLCFMLLFSGLTFAQPSDIDGHWAEEQICKWLDQGVAKGYEDGTFRPDKSITRAEFITLLNKVFDFSDMDQIDFSDVRSKDWFADEIAKAKAADYISGYPDGTIRPNREMNRQEVSFILAKVLNLDTSKELETLSQYKDASNISTWSRGAVGAVVSKGIMSGYPDQTFQPQKNLTRAEAIVAIEGAKGNLGKTYSYDQEGTYGPVEGVETFDGNVEICVPDVTLQNTRITGDLILTEGVGDGNVTLKNVIVEGSTIVRGGGSHSVTLENCTLPTLKITKEGVRIVASGNTTVNLVHLESGAILVETSTEDAGFKKVIASEMIPENAKILLNGKFDQVDVMGKGTNIALEAGSVETLNLNAVAAISGKGKIKTAVITVSGCTIEQEPEKIVKAPNISVTTGVAPSENNGTSKNNPFNFKGAYLEDSNEEITGRTDISTQPTIYLAFDRGAVRDSWDNNQRCVHLEDSSGEDVNIEVFKKDGDDEKRHIYIRPSSKLEHGEQYTIIIDKDLAANNENTLSHTEKVSFTVKEASSGGGGGNSGDNTPDVSVEKPTFESAVIKNKKDIVQVTFTEKIEETLLKNEDFFVTVNGENTTVNEIVYSNDPGIKLIKLTIESAVDNDDTVTLTVYNEDEKIVSLDGGVLEPFTKQPVTVAAPLFSDIDKDTTRKEIYIEFENAIAKPDGVFIVRVNGECYEFSGSAIKLNSKNTKITLPLSNTVKNEDEVWVGYIRGTESVKDETLRTFTYTKVVNETAEPDTGAPTFVSAVMNDKKDSVKVTFSKDMKDPTGKHEDFTVKVNGEKIDVYLAELNKNDTKIINLRLSTVVNKKVPITVSYTNGTLSENFEGETVNWE